MTHKIYNVLTQTLQLRFITGLLCFCLVIPAGFAESNTARIKRIEPEELYDHPAYTHVITAEGNRKVLYVAGQVASDKKGQCVGEGDWITQYIQIMENLKTTLAAGGATFEDVVFIRRFVTNIDDFFAATQNPDKPIADYWDGKMPASTLIEVNRLADRCFLLEFDVIAVVQQ